MAWFGGQRLAATVLVVAAGVAMAPASGLANNPCGAEYEIGAGDTLGHIAKRCGTTVSDIVAANDRITDARAITVGWRIAIPGAEDRRAEQRRLREQRPETGLRGEIVNGRWCALLKTSAGETFGLVSRKVGFISGQSVEVRGKIVPGRECRQEKMLIVSDLSTTSE